MGRIIEIMVIVILPVCIGFYFGTENASATPEPQTIYKTVYKDRVVERIIEKPVINYTDRMKKECITIEKYVRKHGVYGNKQYGELARGTYIDYFAGGKKYRFTRPSSSEKIDSYTVTKDSK